MNAAWLTDVHLNFLSTAKLDDFFAGLRAAAPDAILLSGDIAEAHDLAEYLERFAELPARTYFVLGNHDYYYGWIDRVREEVRDLCERLPRLEYLSCDAASAGTGPASGTGGARRLGRRPLWQLRALAGFDGRL